MYIHLLGDEADMTQNCKIAMTDQSMSKYKRLTMKSTVWELKKKIKKQF